MVFTRYKMPAMPLTINLDATSKTATFFATFLQPFIVKTDN